MKYQKIFFPGESVLCGDSKCYCVSNGENTCHERKFDGDVWYINFSGTKQCRKNECKTTRNCPGNGYWCEESYLTENDGSF